METNIRLSTETLKKLRIEKVHNQFKSYDALINSLLEGNHAK